MEVLTKGTIEYLTISLKDRMNAITTLPAATFEVRDEIDTVKQSARAAQIDGMNARCLIDTTGWDRETYSLYIWFISSPETPKLGPFDFKVN